MKTWRILAVFAFSLTVVTGAVYGGYLYGHKTGYKSAQSVANKQIAALKRQDAIDKNQANKYKNEMWDAISQSLPTKNTSSSPTVNHPLNCTSYNTGVYGQFTNTTCS